MNSSSDPIGTKLELFTERLTAFGRYFGSMIGYYIIVALQPIYEQ